MDDRTAQGEAGEEAGGELVQVVRSAEQVALHLPIAGPGSRILAYAIDWLVITGIEIGLLVVLVLTTSLMSRLLAAVEPWIEALRGGRVDAETSGDFLLLVFAVVLLAGLAVELVYFIVSEASSGGRSLGKAAIGLRVVGEDGLPLTGRASLVRNLLRTVDVLPGSYVVGLVAMLASPRGQRLGDLAGGTLVVRLDRAVAALPVAEYDDAHSPYRFSRSQLAALGPTERMLLRQTLRRLEGLDEAQRGRVVERTARALRARLGAAAPAPGDDEAFLRALQAAANRR